MDIREYDVPYHVRFSIDTGAQPLRPSPAAEAAPGVPFLPFSVLHLGSTITHSSFPLAFRFTAETRCARWYTVTAKTSGISLEWRQDLLKFAEAR